MFMDDMQTYLESLGFTGIYLNNMPDTPRECITIFQITHTGRPIDDGTGTRYLQFQVRRKDALEAERVANQLIEVLNSSSDDDLEKLIFLTPSRWCILRPRVWPTKMTRDDRGFFVWYIEVSAWGQNT